jgi:hypothetical protein
LHRIIGNGGEYDSENIVTFREVLFYLSYITRDLSDDNIRASSSFQFHDDEVTIGFATQHIYHAHINGILLTTSTLRFDILRRNFDTA